MLAAERGKAGERYLISGATITSHEALELVSRISGVQRDVRFLPRSPRARSARPSSSASARAGASRRCAAR